MSIIEEKMHGFQLAKHFPKQPTVFADATNQAILRFDHPHSHRAWKVVREAEISGYWILESVVAIGYNFIEERMDYTRMELVLFENEFERIH